MPQQDKSSPQTISQDEANYRPSTMLGRRCDNCAFFKSGGHCEQVYGYIRWNWTCDHFTWKR